MHDLEWAESQLDQFANLRDKWLRTAHSWLQTQNVHAAWLVGSLGRNEADKWSDVDLVVVCDPNFITERRRLLRELGEVILDWDAPQNAPKEAMHYCNVYDLSELPFSVDWHLWPESLALKPADARPLFEQTEFSTSNKSFEEIQREISARNKGRHFPESSEDDRRSSRLFMLGPICKDLVRGWTESAAMMMEGIGERRLEPTVEAWTLGLQECLNALSKGFPAKTIVRYQTLIAVTAAIVRETGIR